MTPLARMRAALLSNGANRWLAPLLAAILAALVWSHSGGEAKAMSDHEPMEAAIAMCLAILDTALVVGLVSHVAALGRMRRATSAHPALAEVVSSLRPRVRPPPSRFTAADLQVFLR